jgi:type VI secretion system protein ImpM
MQNQTLPGVSRFLTQRHLANAPALWGKLPAYADYLQANVEVAENQGWSQWVDQLWHRRPLPRASEDGLRNPTRGWMQVAQAAQRHDLSQVPVAFILPPGHLPFAPEHYVQGVFIGSQDKVGRLCPLIIYQKVARPWMERIWQSPRPAQDTPPSAETLRSEGQHLLYWWARLIARLHAPGCDFSTLANAVDAIWQRYEPGWGQLIGKPATPPNPAELQAELNRFCANETLDRAYPLRGVFHLPWADWPERSLRAQQPAPAYWMQDCAGGYVHASDNLLKLWGVRQ